MEIEIRREPEDLPVPDSDIAAVRRAVKTVGRLYGAEDAEVSVTLTDDAHIHALNRAYRNVDRPTDVLSFPMAEYERPGDFSIFRGGDPELFNPDTGDFFLGDIVLNLDRIESQAREYGHSERRELAFLTAHSMLHLFGYDHMAEGERSEMERRQREILEGKGYCR